MYFSRDQLVKALTTVEAPGTRELYACDQPRTNAQGDTDRPLKVARDTIKPVPFGVHGSDYLVIDPETGDVMCGACSGVVDATVTEEQK